MRIIVNGEEKNFDAVATIADLVAQFELNPKHVAIELNEQLVKRADYGQTAVSDGDRIEIVTLVGGG